MAQNTSPVFSLVPETKVGIITAASASKVPASATNLVTLVTGDTDGTKVTRIGFKWDGTSYAGSIQIYITDTAGANPILFDEILTTAITSSNTVASWQSVNTYNDLQLKSGQLIKVGCMVLTAGQISCYASIGDFS